LAFVQIWSYPFQDPVLTDHGFFTKPKVFVASFITAGIIAGLIIILFSFVGIYGASVGIGGNPPTVAKYLGIGYFDVIALLMMSSSISVVDSTFSSTARLIGLQLMGYITKGRVIRPEEADERCIYAGRLAMVVMAALGLLPLFASPSVLAATTISGSMVIGLAPVFLLFPLTRKGEKHPLSFHCSFWTGGILGIIQVANALPTSWNIGTGDFANILGGNIYGSILCFGFYIICIPITESRIKRAYSFVFRSGQDYTYDKDEKLHDIAVEKGADSQPSKEKLKAKDVSEESESEEESSESGLEKETSNKNKNTKNETDDSASASSRSSRSSKSE